MNGLDERGRKTFALGNGEIKTSQAWIIYTNCREGVFTNYQNSAAGPECLVNYFQKVALLGKKVALNLWYVDTRPISQKI